MNIYVDADACPVKNFVVQVAKEFKLDVFMFIDTSHQLKDGYSTVITVDRANDSVDFAILNQISKGDVLVTQDYGLASIALAKNVHVIHQHGFLYTNDNIESLLYERFMNKKARSLGGRNTHIKKRTTENDIDFLNSFRKLIIGLLSCPN